MSPVKQSQLVFGIDLSSTETKPSAFSGLDDKLQVGYFGFVLKDNDILTILKFYSSQVIAIDAPLSLPMELHSPEESPPCQAITPQKGRACERELAKLGIPCYFTTQKSIIKDLVYRGIKLKNKLCQAGFNSVENKAHACYVRLFGKPLPRKTTPQGIACLKACLGELLPSFKPYLSMFDHNLCDAAISAYTALLYCQNRVAAVGNDREGLIFVPQSN